MDKASEIKGNTSVFAAGGGESVILNNLRIEFVDLQDEQDDELVLAMNCSNG